MRDWYLYDVPILVWLSVGSVAIIVILLAVFH